MSARLACVVLGAGPLTALVPFCECPTTYLLVGFLLDAWVICNVRLLEIQGVVEAVIFLN